MLWLEAMEAEDEAKTLRESRWACAVRDMAQRVRMMRMCFIGANIG